MDQIGESTDSSFASESLVFPEGVSLVVSRAREETLETSGYIKPEVLKSLKFSNGGWGSPQTSTLPV